MDIYKDVAKKIKGLVTDKLRPKILNDNKTKVEYLLHEILQHCPKGTRIRAVLVNGKFVMDAWSPSGITSDMSEAGIQEW